MLESVCIHVSDFCNLKCSHCWSNSGPTGNSYLNPSSIIRFVDAIAPLGLLRISLSGGEPLLYNGILELAYYFRAKNLSVVITTNGSVLQQLNRFLTSFTSVDGCWLSVRVSIDGPKKHSEYLRGDSTYDKAITAVKMVKETLSSVSVNAVVTPDIDLEQWKGYFYDMKKLQVDEISLMTLSPRGRGQFPVNRFSAIKNNIVTLEKAARNIGFEGRINKWDYLTVNNGYLLVEHNGNVILPGVHDANDKIAGSIDMVTTDGISSFLQINRKKLNYNMNE